MIEILNDRLNWDERNDEGRGCYQTAEVGPNQLSMTQLFCDPRSHAVASLLIELNARGRVSVQGNDWNGPDIYFQLPKSRSFEAAMRLIANSKAKFVAEIVEVLQRISQD
jgi:hypothetical protein